MTRRRTFFVYGGAVLVVHLVLMAGVWISAPHNGGDNAGYVALAEALLEGDGYVETWDPERPRQTRYPPVFPLLLALPIALGARTWAALKIVPALATTAAVLLTYLWAARRRDPFFGALVAFLFAAGSALLWYSHWILSEVPFTAFTLLALVALERAVSPARPGEADRGGARRTRAESGWLLLGFAAAVLAYLTRSAGLPLLLAVGGWLALRRRWGGLTGFGIAAGVPALLWWIWGRGGDAVYVRVFWMVNPYRPELGEIGPIGLVERVVGNATAYATRHVPEGLMGAGGKLSLLLALLILALAVVGWGRRIVDGWRGDRFRSLHAAELFLPLYTGLILLWPEVWSGDRFALPLFPLLLFYAGDALLVLVGRTARRAVAPVGVVATLLVAVPAVTAWGGARDAARQCAELMRNVGAGAFACHGPEWEEFDRAARWVGANLPEGSVVLSRKPRIFYLLSHTPGRTYPFTVDPVEFAAAAEEAGARYVLLDHLDRQGAAYVAPVVSSRPEAFCAVAAFGRPGGVRTQLLGIVDPDAGAGGSIVDEGAGPRVVVPACPMDLQPATERSPPALPDLAIPLLSYSSPPEP